MPWGVILIKAVEAWRVAHNGLLPGQTPGLAFKEKRAEKNAFNQTIKAMKKGPPSHGLINYVEEAMAFSGMNCY
jgi:hypothetical protein